MENSHTRQNKMECSSSILKEAFTIPFKSGNLIFFSFLTSIPLFCFLVFYEMFLQTTLVETSEKLTQTHFKSNWLIPLHGSIRMAKDFSYKLVQFALLRLVPLHLLELCTAIVTVDLASRTYAKGKPLSHKPFDKTRFKGILATSAYIYFVSTCYLLGSVWLVTNYYLVLRSFVYSMFSAAVYRVVCVGLFSKYLEWTAVWNMSLVISISEDLHGADALALAAYFNRGSERRGFFLMLVFFVWEVGLRWACFYSGYGKKGWMILGQACLIFIGNVLKWVACFVYFYHRQAQISVKFYVETGKEGTA